MSGFIPMISDSPPPLDNDGGFDDWNDDDEFGNFAAADSCNVAVNSSSDQITNTLSFNSSSATAFQRDSHFVADTNSSFANFDKFDSIANMVNAENDNNLNTVHEEIPDYPNSQQLCIDRETEEPAQNGHQSIETSITNTGNLSSETHHSGQLSQCSVSDSGIICSNDISPVQQSDNLETGELCDTTNTSDMDDSICDSQITSGGNDGCISNDERQSLVVQQNETSSLRDDHAGNGKASPEYETLAVEPESCNHLDDTELKSDSDQSSVVHNNIIHAMESKGSSTLDSDNELEGHLSSLTDNKTTSIDDTVGDSESHSSVEECDSESPTVSSIRNNCSKNKDIGPEGQIIQGETFSESPDEAQSTRHIDRQHSELIDNGDISNNLNNANSTEEIDSGACSVSSGHLQNAEDCSHTCDNKYSDSGESEERYNSVCTTQNNTKLNIEGSELDSVDNGEIDSKPQILGQSESCGSDKCDEFADEKLEDDGDDFFSDFSSAFPLQKCQENSHALSQHSSASLGDSVNENTVDDTTRSIPSNISDTGGEFDAADASSQIQHSHSADFDTQSPDENWAAFSVSTDETENKSSTSQTLTPNLNIDSGDADNSWADFGNTAQLSSDVKFDDDDDFEDFSAFESPPTDTFSYQTSQDGIEKYAYVVDRCFSSQPVDIKCLDNAVNSLIILLDSSKGPHDSSKETENEKNCDNIDSGYQVWRCLNRDDQGDALTYQWMDSSGNKKFFKTIHVDTQNMLFGHKKSSVPIFASGLGMLEPTKGPADAQKNGNKLTQEFVSKETDNQRVGDNISAVQFDWMGSGLVNPLEGNGGKLDLDFLAINESSSSGKTVFDSDVLKKSELELKVGPQLEELLTSVKPTCFEPTKTEENLSGEGNKIITTLPDLSFMKAKVLMFPLLKNKKY